MKLPHLGGLTARQFLREYWQKKPLLVRQAFPGFGDALTPNELAGLACEEGAQSRLVLESRGKWRVEYGPFPEERFARLPKKGWSLLVQGVNHFLTEGADLLQRFDFIPTARLDDLMVSFAPDGGGVGPHFDSYDVFLLQGYGKRLWRVSEQTDMALVEGAPLRILRHFETSQEWLVEPGDLLYLPPRLAHWGIAVGPCMTWSIGFRAPSAQELGTQFLAYLQERICLEGMYADPDLKLQSHPSEISPQMIDRVARLLRDIRWNKLDVARFLGIYLTEPKPHVVFEKPRPLGLERFRSRLEKSGVALDLKSRMLISGTTVFINGEAVEVSPDALPCLRDLADRRWMKARCSVAVAELLRQWYNAGYLKFR
ncbi:MAG: cupin domain-containing protein [Methylophilaceae bacterium]|nr:cupin domain-containing protein [Methylophilaceae bacterium]